MKKRIIEMSVLAGFMIVMLSCNKNKPESITYNQVFCEKTAELPDIIIETESLDEIQNEIRNEIFYGELEEVALIVQAEAGNQDELGKRYVADVIWNRVDDSAFPDSPLDVIYQANPIQFATTVDGAMGKAGYTITEDVFQIVLEEYENRTNPDIIYFRTDRYGSGTPAFKYGNHYFSTR